MSKSVEKSHPEIFSLGVGGPLYHIFASLGLVEKPLLRYRRRMIVLALLTWLPLFILALYAGSAFGGVNIPFIHDLDVHVRFLVALPLLLYAEVIAHDRFHLIVEQFLKRNIIPLADRKKFQQVIASTMWLRNLLIVEVLLLIVVYTLGHYISISYLPWNVSSWFASNDEGMPVLTAAGYWYVYISLPIFQFILLRWYFRILVWYRFLWQVSRIRLQLNSLHPDKAGGIGFLANSIYALAPFLLAHSILLAGMILNRIWNTGVTLMDFKIEIVSVFLVVLSIPLLPLLFFMFQLLREKRVGTLNYGNVANRYVNEFRQKWIAPDKTSHSMLGTSDIQSLADLYNSFEVSNKMRIAPFGTQSFLILLVLTILPLLPLLLTILSLEKFVFQIFGLIF